MRNDDTRARVQLVSRPGEGTVAAIRSVETMEMESLYELIERHTLQLS